MIYEWRIYRTAQGRMQALHQRFRQATLALFERHGLEVVGFWQELDGEDELLYYMLRFPHVAARDEAWQAFQNDEEWQQAKAASEEDGMVVTEIESILMEPTDYSPMA